MKVKKMLAFAASMTVCAAMFAGCGSTGSGDTATTEKKDDAATTTAAAADDGGDADA